MKIIITRNKVTLAFKAQFPLIDEDLQRELEKIDYKVPSLNPSVLKISRDGSESIAKRWVKNKTEIHYDPKRGFLSSEGINIDETSEGFSYIHKIAENLLGKEAESNFKWAEINFACRGIGKFPPLDVLRKTAKTELFNSIQEIFGEKINPFSLEFYSANNTQVSDIALTEITNWFHFSIKPLIENPKYYLASVVYRKSDVSKVEEISKSILKLTISLIENLEVI